MTKLNLDRSIDRLTKKLNSLYPADNNNDPSYWKGKRIIPKDQWLRMAHTISKKNQDIQRKNADYNIFQILTFEFVFPFGSSRASQKKRPTSELYILY